MKQFNTNRRTVLGGMAGALAAASLGAKAAPAKRPNIVLFLGEGLRWDEFSFMGNTILKTPNMDRIALEGATFHNAFCTNALCLPARASVLTGAYSHTTGATTNDDANVPPSFRMFTDVLRDAGYETAFIGKSHVGGALLDHKWDYYFGFRGQADYLHPRITEIKDGVTIPEKVYSEYVDDLLTDKAVEFVESRNGDKPFCLLLWFYAPHSPFYRPRRMMDMFNGVHIPKPASFDEDLEGYPGKPRAVATADNKFGQSQVFTDDPRSLEEIVKDHYVGVESNDEDVGRVVGAIEKRGWLDDTAVMLSSDHGFFLGEHDFYDKRLMYEPSIRIPMMIRYPRLIKPGVKRDEMVLNIDIAPTLLQLAGAKPMPTIQGRSMLPLALGRTVPDWRHDWLYEYFEYPGFENVRPCRGIRTDRWKLIYWFLKPAEFELYDLDSDPDEMHNLYGQPGYEAITEHLKARLNELRRETNDHYVWHPTREPVMSVTIKPPPTDLVEVPMQ